MFLLTVSNSIRLKFKTTKNRGRQGKIFTDNLTTFATVKVLCYNLNRYLTEFLKSLTSGKKTMAISRERQEQIRYWHRQGLSQNKIVEKTGINKPTVNSYVKKIRKQDELKEKEICLAYNEIKPYKKTVEDLKNAMLGYMNFVLENCQDREEFLRMDPRDKHAFAVKLAEIIKGKT